MCGVCFNTHLNGFLHILQGCILCPLACSSASHSDTDLVAFGFQKLTIDYGLEVMSTRTCPCFPHLGNLAGFLDQLIPIIPIWWTVARNRTRKCVVATSRQWLSHLPCTGSDTLVHQDQIWYADINSRPSFMILPNYSTARAPSNYLNFSIPTCAAQHHCRCSTENVESRSKSRYEEQLGDGLRVPLCGEVLRHPFQQ